MCLVVKMEKKAFVPLKGKRRKRVFFDKDSPFPVPIASVSGEAAHSTKWSFYTGEIEDNHVAVQYSGDMDSLYSKGFFGKGNLSRHQPVYEQGGANYFSKRRGNEDMLKITSRRKYVRHLAWSSGKPIDLLPLRLGKDKKEADKKKHESSTQYTDNKNKSVSEDNNKKVTEEKDDVQLMECKDNTSLSDQDNVTDTWEGSSTENDPWAMDNAEESQLFWGVDSSSNTATVVDSNRVKSSVDSQCSVSTFDNVTMVDNSPITSKIESSHDTAMHSFSPKSTMVGSPYNVKGMDTPPKTTMVDTSNDTNLVDTSPKITMVYTSNDTTTVDTSTKTTMVDILHDTTVVDTSTKTTIVDTSLDTTVVDTSTKTTMDDASHSTVDNPNKQTMVNQSDGATKPKDIIEAHQACREIKVKLTTKQEVDVLCLSDHEDGDLFVVNDTDESDNDDLRTPSDDITTQSGDESSEKLQKRFKWEPALKRDPCRLKERLHLTFEEAFFLSYGLGCLVVLDNKVPLNLTEMWREFSSRQDSFVINYIVYHNLRSKGWVIKPGLKFGGEFMVYRDGPPFCHASYVVLVKRVREKCVEGEMSWKRLSAQNRVTEQVGKKYNILLESAQNRVTKQVGKALMLCYVIVPDDLSDEDMKSPKCITRLKIQEVILQRWMTKLERENLVYMEIP